MLSTAKSANVGFRPVVQLFAPPRKYFFTQIASPNSKIGLQSLHCVRFIGRPFVKLFALCYRTVDCLSRSLSVLSVTLVYCRQTVPYIKMKLGTQVGLGPGPHCVRLKPRSPPRKGHSPQFMAHICCGQMAGWIKMPLGREIGLGPSDIVLDGNPAPPPQKGAEIPSNFRPMTVVAKQLDGSRCHFVCR